MSMQQLASEELQALREDLVRKLWQADKEITRRQHEMLGMTVRQYGRSIPVDELIRSCTIESEIPRAAGCEDKGKD